MIRSAEVSDAEPGIVPIKLSKREGNSVVPKQK